MAKPSKGKKPKGAILIVLGSALPKPPKSGRKPKAPVYPKKG